MIDEIEDVDDNKQLLDHVLDQQRQDRAADLSEQDYFEIFCAEQKKASQPS
ncbi:MAG: hypothetical protein OXH52_17220 [Gammaproteobacteria bacterium]|nr:hypothetical protein [Gammaproteobacteria bacterium]